MLSWLQVSSSVVLPTVSRVVRGACAGRIGEVIISSGGTAVCGRALRKKHRHE